MSFRFLGLIFIESCTSFFLLALEAPEGEADPSAVALGPRRHRMLVRPLACATHDDQIAVL